MKKNILCQNLSFLNNNKSNNVVKLANETLLYRAAFLSFLEKLKTWIE